MDILLAAAEESHTRGACCGKGNKNGGKWRKSGGAAVKRKTTKELLAESFREVAERKNIDKITVRDITENCGYSPATFYRQFKDKYDLIAWDYTRELKAILSGENGSGTDWRTVLHGSAGFFHERKTYLANLFLHTSGLESFLAYMQETNYQSLRNLAETASGEPMDAMAERYLRVYALGTAQFTCEWILGKWEASAEELAMVYEQTLPAPLQGYLR